MVLPPKQAFSISGFQHVLGPRMAHSEYPDLSFSHFPERSLSKGKQSPGALRELLCLSPTGPTGLGRPWPREEMWSSWQRFRRGAACRKPGRYGLNQEVLFVCTCAVLRTG